MTSACHVWQAGFFQTREFVEHRHLPFVELSGSFRFPVVQNHVPKSVTGFGKRNARYDRVGRATAPAPDHLGSARCRHDLMRKAGAVRIDPDWGHAAVHIDGFSIFPGKFDAIGCPGASGRGPITQCSSAASLAAPSVDPCRSSHPLQQRRRQGQPAARCSRRRRARH